MFFSFLIQLKYLTPGYPHPLIVVLGKGGEDEDIDGSVIGNIDHDGGYVEFQSNGK